MKRARLGSARLGSARLGSARLGSARLGSARLGSARLGSARLLIILFATSSFSSAFKNIAFPLHDCRRGCRTRAQHSAKIGISHVRCLRPITSTPFAISSPSDLTDNKLALKIESSSMRRTLFVNRTGRDGSAASMRPGRAGVAAGRSRCGGARLCPARRSGWFGLRRTRGGSGLLREGRPRLVPCATP